MSTPTTIEETNAPATIIGSVPVDTGRLLIVDPCHLPADLLKSLTSAKESGFTLGVLVATPSGDGMHPVWNSTVDGRHALIIDDAYGINSHPWLAESID